MKWSWSVVLLLAVPLAGAEVIAFPPPAERGVLEVGAPRDAYPYSFLNERGEWEGFTTEVMDAVARVMRLQIRRTALPARVLRERFEKGEFSLVQHYQQSADREAFADFTVPLLTLQGAVFVQRNGPVRRLEDLAGRDFGVFNLKSLGEQFLATRGIAARLVPLESPAAALRALDEGRIAGAFVSQLTGMAIVRRDGLKGVAILDERIEQFDVRHCLAVHRGDAQLLARLNEGLALLHHSGEFERIYRKWFGHLGGATFTREEVTTYVAAALALALAVAAWGLWRQHALRRHIEQLNADLERRVAARTAELNERVREVEHLNRELEAFSYSVSHDLRTPLRNITGFLELLAKRTAGRLDAEEARFVATVGGDAARMGRLIDELLEFSRIGRAELKLERVPLDELVAEAREELRGEMAGRTIEWRVAGLPAVHGDRALLRQVVTNLLANAVKFTRRREPAVIEIGVEAADDARVTCFVRDNGAGFNPKYADKLFGVFQRLHNQREFEGTGIGLANVKRIVERHGGTVQAEGGLEQGAVFRFSLPGGKVA